MKKIIITFTFSVAFLILLQVMEIESTVSNDQPSQQSVSGGSNQGSKSSNGGQQQTWPSSVNGNGQIKAAVNVVNANILTGNNVECTRCGGTRLIGCMFGRCFYRCYRRCNDGNGTTYDEAIRFTLPGHRR